MYIKAPKIRKLVLGKGRLEKSARMLPNRSVRNKNAITHPTLINRFPGRFNAKALKVSRMNRLNVGGVGGVYNRLTPYRGLKGLPICFEELLKF